MSVRVRFAPSPTGPLHIGGVRTALYNYLFARKHGGKMILRVEDTDQTRFVEGAEDYINKSLEWCGIEIDEGVKQGGEFGPYKQSDRKHLYIQYVEQLIKDDKAYYAFDTPEELEKMREELTAKGVPTPQYDIRSRMGMRNSLTLSKEEVEKLIADGTPYVVRIKMPEDYLVEFKDIIRGEISVNTNTLDDKVLFKSDGMPTYHMANIVDDHLMEITHVIRGEEWLPSAPMHVMLYRFLGWEEPEFAHLPLLLKPKGNGKLSKRDGDKLGFPVFPMEWKDPKSGEMSSGYKESGYYRDAFVNILAFLGWNPGTEQELFSMDELIQSFSLERVGKAGARFDFDKAKWFNEQYLRMQSDADIAKDFDIILKEKGIDYDLAKTERIVALVKERVGFVKEIWDQTAFFFQSPEEYDAKTVKKRWKEGVSEHLKNISDKLVASGESQAETLKPIVMDHIQANELNMGQIMNCIRLSIVGAPAGPDLFDIIEIIGVEETVARIEKAINVLG